MAVNCQMAEAVEIPGIFLIDLDSHQMRHDAAQPAIVVAFHPDYFHLALGIRQLPDVTQKPPMSFGKAAEIEVGEDVTQQDQAAEALLPQHARRVLSTTDSRAQMQVGDNESVTEWSTHHLLL